MNDIITRPNIKDEIKAEHPRLHKVILINDDFTPREFVVMVLKAEFRMSEDQALRVMITAHRRGVCVVAVFTKDVAEAKATNATDAGRRLGYPLLFHDGARGMSSGGFKSPDLVRNQNVLPFQGPLCRMPIGNANASMPDHNIRWPIPACFGGSGVVSGAILHMISCPSIRTGWPRLKVICRPPLILSVTVPAKSSTRYCTRTPSCIDSTAPLGRAGKKRSLGAAAAHKVRAVRNATRHVITTIPSYSSREMPRRYPRTFAL
jgi:ATP-dependent Clp protease adaptor protein ClpS